MNVIVSTAPFFLRPVREAFGAIADAGFEGVEVMVTRDEDTQDPFSLFEAASEHGLRIEAIHAPFLLLLRRIWGTDPIGKVGRAIEMAGHVGAPIVVAHPPFRWQGEYERWLREDMPALAGAAGVTVAVENMFPLRAGRIPGPRLHVASLDDHAHVTLDTSHAAVAGLDLTETAASFGRRLSHVHLSNNTGKGWDSHLPVYEGAVPLGALLRHLDVDGYAGAISLELDLRRWLNDPLTLRDVLARNRAFCRDAVSVAAH